ncbi:MAG: ATP-binding protein [Peptostreptococcaceae bacterium]
MVDLYKYKEILTLLNISIIISLPLISIVLFIVLKNKSFLVIFCSSLLEMGVNLFLESGYYWNSIQIILVCLVFITKLLLIAYTIKSLKLEKDYIIYIVITSIIITFMMTRKVEYFITCNIILNILILKKFTIDNIKNITLEFILNKQKLKTDKEFLKNSDDKVLVEYELQNRYKNEIFNINNKINKSMDESDTPIFILDINKELIYSNNAFNSLIIEDNFNPNNFEILSYLKTKFTERNQLIETIKNINKLTYNNMIIKSKDGKTFRFICIADLIEKQNITICILNDITKTTIIQNKLRESEERYRNLMDILNEGVIIHNGDSISYTNSKALDLFDLYETKEELNIEHIKCKVSKKFRKEFLNNIQTIKLGNQERILTKVETIKGNTIELITTNLGLNEKDMYISIAIDITDLENAITNIEQSEKTYKLLLHTLPEGIIIIDRKRKKHIYRNESIMGILKNVGVEKLNEVVKTYLEEAEFGQFKKFTIDNKNNIDISVAIIERKEDDTLVVVVRTLDQEYKSKKMKEELKEISKKTKFKTDFLYNIVNDIKNPIYSIYNANDKLNKEKGKYNIQYIENYTRLLRQNCYRLIRLSNNINEIREIENGNSKLSLKKCDIVKLTKSIIKNSQYYVYEKGIDISFSSSIKEKNILIDVDKVEKIVLNILSNAIKFTNKGGRIILEIKNIENKVAISIKDTGIGIPEEKLEDIFDSFEQVDRTLSRGTEGTGMGLYLVKKISEIHNIDIKVESKLGAGSEFTLILNECNRESHLIVENGTYRILDNSEKVDIEFSDIYFDLSS